MQRYYVYSGGAFCPATEDDVFDQMGTKLPVPKDGDGGHELLRACGMTQEWESADDGLYQLEVWSRDHEGVCFYLIFLWDVCDAEAVLCASRPDAWLLLDCWLRMIRNMRAEYAYAEQQAKGR